MIDLVLNFGIGVWSGWGVVGMNLLGQLAQDPDINIMTTVDLNRSFFMSMDPMHHQVMDGINRRYKACTSTEDAYWIDPVGNDLNAFKAGMKHLIGRVIIEKPDVQNAMRNLEPCEHLLTGSTWNQELIENMTGRKAEVIHEGIDPSVFCPGPKSGWLPNTFNIYSCGKVEYRKAQDVVLKAFKTFSQRHDDARLVTIWNSPFADLGNGYRGILEHPIWAKDNGFLDVKRWAQDNLVDPDKVLELGPVPNWTVPAVLREMDVMVAPSRVESCTSLPVMEAMACGVPVIASYHTGMKDLLTKSNSFRLMHQKPITGSSEYFFPAAHCEWYESDLEEIDTHLEYCYQHRDAAKFVGDCGSYWIRNNRTWRHFAQDLKAWLLALT